MFTSSVVEHHLHVLLHFALLVCVGSGLFCTAGPLALLGPRAGLQRQGLKVRYNAIMFTVLACDPFGLEAFAFAFGRSQGCPFFAVTAGLGQGAVRAPFLPPDPHTAVGSCYIYSLALSLERLAFWAMCCCHNTDEPPRSPFACTPFSARACLFWTGAQCRYDVSATIRTLRGLLIPGDVSGPVFG